MQKRYIWVGLQALGDAFSPRYLPGRTLTPGFASTQIQKRSSPRQRAVNAHGIDSERGSGSHAMFNL